MEQEEVNQIAQAVLVASDPTRASLHQQALQFVQERLNHSSEPWRIGLSLFVDTYNDGTRRYQPQVRFYGLRILEEFFDNRFEPLPQVAFQELQSSIVNYIQSEYIYGSAESNGTFIRNKFSHVLTLFFLCSYLDQWQTFFADFFSLIRTQGVHSDSTTFNLHVALLLFHVVIEISGEVADQLLRAARTYSGQRNHRDARVRDAVRERDVAVINEAVLTIVADSVERLSCIRKGEPNKNDPRLEETVDWGIRAFGSYVGWIDINLTVTPTTIPLFFNLLSDTSLPIRLATSVTFLRMVAKGLKEPSDKLQLFKVLSLGEVLESLEGRTRLEQTLRGNDTDEGEESYREALGRLLNAYGLELSKLADDTNAVEGVKHEAASMLIRLRPILLRFLGDPYDDTTSTIFPLLSNIIGSLKKIKRSSPQDITDETRNFLRNTVTALLNKMRWDEDSDLDDMDEDDKHAFEALRKGDLRAHLDSILVIDQDLAINAVRDLVMKTLADYENGLPIKWNDAELAIYLIYIFGDINKSGGKGRSAFCQMPASSKELRKDTNYSDYPFTSHGEMLMALVRSGTCAYPNGAVSMQYFEACARYGDFFKVRKECIIPFLEAMISERGIHHSDKSVRSRMFYLFCKFIKDVRSDIPVEIVPTLLNAIRDLLKIDVQLPELDNPAEQDLLSEAVSNPGIFDSQLYLFEVIGLLVSLMYKSPAESEAVLLSYVSPLLDDLQANLQLIKCVDDVLPIIKVHHVIMALGDIAKGYPDLPRPLPPGYIVPPIAVFRQMTQAIVVSLGAMNVFKPVRDASRFAFARIVATAGSQITDFIPTMMENFLVHFDTTELVDFFTFIGLLMHRLGMDMFHVLNQLVSPLHERIVELLASPITGTDDRLEHLDTKKAYLTFLNNILINKLSGVFITDQNRPQLVSIFEKVMQIAEDASDPSSQRQAFTFFGRCVSTWGRGAGDENDSIQLNKLPGFELFIYENLVPLAFRVPLSPSSDIKDGQMLVVCHEVASLLQSAGSARGEEFYQFLVTVFLPSQGCPAETAVEFVTKLREFDQKCFRKYFADFVRASKSTAS